MKTFVDPSPKEFLVSRLRLDPQNPRLKLHQGGSSEREIIERLCKLGTQSPSQVVKHILTDRGFLHNEIPVVYKADGKSEAIVIDGNRRVAALKMILNHSLIPSTRRGLHSDCEKLEGLVPTKIRCWVTHSKSDAKRIVYRAHNEGTKEWETLAKYSTHYDYYKEGQTIPEIADITGSDFKKIVMQINTWLLVECMLEHIPDFQMESEGITSFERVTTAYSGFPGKIGVSVTPEGIYQIPASTNLAELIHKIYLNSAKSSGFTRDVGNNDSAREKFLKGLIPSGYRPPIDGDKPTGGESGDSSGPSGKKSGPEAPPAGGTASPKGGSANPALPNERAILSVKKNVGPKAFEVFKEYTQLPLDKNFPIASAALTRVMIETTLKFHAKRLKCYDETPEQQQTHRSDQLDAIANKLKKKILSLNLAYSSDLVAAIANCCKSITELNDVMHKDTCFAARPAVKSSLAALASAVENLVKIPS